MGIREVQCCFSDKALLTDELCFGSVQELRRKLPVTRTQFSWDNAVQLSLSREAARQASVGRLR